MTKMNSQQQNCPSMAPLVIIMVILIITIVGFIIWIVFLLRKECPKCDSVPTIASPSVLLYGFAPGVSSREITNADGVLTPTTNGELSLMSLNQSNPANQQWQLIQTASNQVILQHRLTEQYIKRINDNQVSLTANLNDALSMNLIGPSRNGRVYKLKLNNFYLATAQDLSVGLLNVEGTQPLNTEWIIALGTCQATGNNNCPS